MTEPLRQKMPRVKDKDYLGFIAQLPCLYGHKVAVHVCHIRFGERCEECGGIGEKEEWFGPGLQQVDWFPCRSCKETGYRYGKRPTGAGEKPSDRWTWPGCPECHLTGPESQHSMNEREFHQSRGVDILAVAKHLQEIYDQHGMPAALMVAAEYLGEVG